MHTSSTELSAAGAGNARLKPAHTRPIRDGPVRNGTDTTRLTGRRWLCVETSRRPSMPVILVVIVSILLVTAARLRRRMAASATNVDDVNGPRSRWMAGGFSPRVIATCLLLLTGLATGGLPSAHTSRPLVYVVPIEGVIDLGLAPFLARTIRDAEEAGAAAVVLDINTLGGRVDAAIVMRDALLQSRLRTIAFVNPRAISAGALLALATETIVMTAGARLARPCLSSVAAARPGPQTRSPCPTCERSSPRRRSAAVVQPSSQKPWSMSTWRFQASWRKASS